MSGTFAAMKYCRHAVLLQWNSCTSSTSLCGLSTVMRRYAKRRLGLQLQRCPVANSANSVAVAVVGAAGCACRHWLCGAGALPTQPPPSKEGVGGERLQASPTRSLVSGLRLWPCRLTSRQGSADTCRPCYCPMVECSLVCASSPAMQPEFSEQPRQWRQASSDPLRLQVTSAATCIDTN
jgi:hypothetical protein